MKDAFGQARTSMRGRELTIATLFLVLVGVGVWTVALPALSEDPEKAEATEEPGADASSEPKTTTEKSP